jgi:type IX secretion system PorP/SprF family membrane protein
MFRKYYLIIILLFIKISGNAQFYPVFSQYLSNGIIINPGYTGSKEVLCANILYRKQMLGFSGSPEYFVFSAHSPLKNQNIGIGLMLLDEKIGCIHNTHFYFNYAFRIPTQNGRLALGIKAGVDYSQYNWNHLFLNDTNDPAFSENTQTSLLPNFGTGIYFYNDNLSLGFAIPYFLSFKDNNNYQSYTIQSNFKNYNFLFSSGYLFDISRNFKIKPSLLYKYYLQKQSQLDINSTFIFMDNRFNFSMAYRINEAIAGSVEIQINPQFRVSYTYEYAGQVANFFNYTSHEFGLQYLFMYRIKSSNPRYF